jgi:hypothetical protein
VASDRVEDVTNDERVQDAVMANSKDVRRDWYQEKARPVILERASEARAEMRGSPPPASGTAPNTALDVLEVLRAAGVELSEEKAAAIRAALARSSDPRGGGAA